MTLNLPYEDSYLGFSIYIELNPDQYQEGFSWSICKDNEELDSGIDFDERLALKEAQNAVDRIIKKN